MTALLRGRDIVGLPVVTIATGEDVAEVGDLVFEPGGSLVGFTLRKRSFLRGRMKEVLAASHVAGVGPAAVMIETDDLLDEPADAPAQITAAEGGDDVLHDQVITESGVILGSVADVVVLCGGGLSLAGYQLTKPDKSDAFIPFPAQRSVSGSHLVVPDEFTALVRNDLVGLGEAVVEYRRRA